MDLADLLWLAIILWLLGLSGAIMFLQGRLTRLEEEQVAMNGVLQQIGRDLADVRQVLGGVARSQEIATLRRDLLADLRLELAERKPARARATATAGGVANSGQAGNVQTGAGLQVTQEGGKSGV